MTLTNTEMWGNHCLYVYANRHYGNGGTAAANFTARMQGTDYQNIGGGLSAHLNAIENHNPNATNVNWPWIPEVLPYDLFDNENDNVTISTTASTNQLPGLNCHLASLESFNPNSINGIWPWIPEGLPYDLFDDRNDAAFNGFVTDNVNGYINSQLFNALQSDVRSIPAFRDRLLQLNGNNQQVQVNALFNAYNY